MKCRNTSMINTSFNVKCFELLKVLIKTKCLEENTNQLAQKSLIMERKAAISH